MGETLVEAQPASREMTRTLAKNLVGRPRRLYDDAQEVLAMRRILVISLCLLAATACASTPPRVQRSEFEDIPVPKGLTVDINRSTVIESPAVKAARIFYKGRLEVDSLAVALRTTLEANGWRHLSSTTASDKGITQVYDKPGSSLQVTVYESWYYTWVEMAATRLITPAGTASTPPTATPTRQ
jgi:hypothetical protein